MSEFGDGPFGAWKVVELPGGPAYVADLAWLARETGRDLDRLPYSIRVLVENALRNCGRGVVTEQDVHDIQAYIVERANQDRAAAAAASAAAQK